MKKVTNYSYQIVQEGIRLSYTYSELNDNGDIISSNNRKSFIVTDEETKEKLRSIQSYLEQRDL